MSQGIALRIVVGSFVGCVVGAVVFTTIGAELASSYEEWMQHMFPIMVSLTVAGGVSAATGKHYEIIAIITAFCLIESVPIVNVHDGWLLLWLFFYGITGVVGGMFVGVAVRLILAAVKMR